MAENTHLTSEIKGLESFVYLGLAADSTSGFVAGFAKLIELVKQEHTQLHRGHLDQMSPAAQRQLVRELTYLQSLAPGFANGTAAIVTHGQEIDDTAEANPITLSVVAGVVTGTSDAA